MKCLILIILLLLLSPAFAGTNLWTLCNMGIDTPSFRGYAISMSASNNQILYLSGGSFSGSPLLYRSIDGSNTWSFVTAFTTHIRSVQINPLDSNIVYLGTYSQGVFKSTTGGVTWSSVTSGLPVGSFDPYVVAIDPSNPNTLYAGGILSKTTTGGQSWSVITAGLTQDVRAIAIDPSNPQILYVGTNDYLYKSINGGNSWSLLTTLTNAYFTGIAVNPTNSQILYIATKPISSTVSYVYKSINGGSSWFVSTTGFNIPSNGMIIVDPSNSNNVFICSGGVYRSMDAGATWSLMNGYFGDSNQIAMTVTGTTTLFLASGIGGWCYTIIPTGISSSHWQQFNEILPIITNLDIKLSESSSSSK